MKSRADTNNVHVGNLIKSVSTVVPKTTSINQTSEIANNKDEEIVKLEDKTNEYILKIDENRIIIRNSTSNTKLAPKNISHQGEIEFFVREMKLRKTETTTD